MKIALLSRWYWEEHRRHGEEGGTTQQLAEAVAAQGHEVVVLSQSPDTKKLRKSQIGTLETWLSPRDKRRDFVTGFRDKMAKKAHDHRKIYSDALDLRDFLAKRGPFDVIWAHAEAPDGLICAIAAQTGVKLPPVLLQIQALRYRFVKGAPVFTQRLPLGLAFRQATRILANSEMIAGLLSNYAMPNHSATDLLAKVRVVYPNLQRTFLEAAQGDPDESPPMKDRVLFLGALNQGKGAVTFMKAIPKTEVQRRSGVFAVIGDFTEDNRGFAKRWAELQETTRVQVLGSRIEYLGAVSSFEVIRQIKLARVVVLPSLFDAFSRALVESLALGRPVVTTDKVGAARIVKEHQCGIVIPPNDSDSLAQAIDAVLSPIVPFAENAARLGPSVAIEFSAEATAQKIIYNLERTAGLEHK
jgi:glycosyltransferase involved in cell wall biosynthesis